MTDTYSNDSNWDNVIKWAGAQRRKVSSDVMDGVDGDPDQAARAVKLSQTTGDPAALINMDVDDYAGQVRKAAAAEIVGRNAVLRRWVEEDPMVAKVAADDWPAVDTYDQKLNKLSLFAGGGADVRLMHALARGFGEAFDTSRAGGLDELWHQSPASWLMLYAPYIGGTLALRTISAIGFGALPEAAAQLSKELGDDEVKQDMSRQGMKGFAEYAMTHIGFHTPPLQEAAVMAAQAARVAEAARLAKPYLEKGEPVPLGLSYLTDQYNAALARLSRETLTEVEKAADDTQIKGRSPEIFNDLTKLRGEFNVELSHEAALKLYEGKAPKPDDGLLGFVTDIEKQIADGVQFDDRIRIPLNDWINNASPEVKKALEDDVTIMKNGLTPREADAVKPQPLDTPLLEPAPVDQSSAGKFAEAVQSERKATKSDPLFNCMSPCIPTMEGFPFDPNAIMPKDRQAHYAKAMDEQRAHDEAAMTRKIEQDAKMRVSKQWKDAAAGMVSDIEREVGGRPEFRIDDLFRKGRIGGQKLEEIPKIDPKFLTEEQKKVFPKAFMKKGGLNPDQVATLFGLQNGEEMIGRYSRYLQAKGDLQPRQFRDRVIGEELENRLTAMFGDPAEVALEAAREHVYGSKNLDMLHEDTVAMGMAAGQQIPLSKADMIKQTEKRFDKMLVKDVDYATIGAKVYRNASKLEDRLLVGDAQGAFKYAQGKEAQYALGLELKDFLKDKKSLERLSKTYAKREPENKDPDSTNFVHQILNQIGETTRRSPADITDAIAKSKYKDLQDFVEKVRADGYDIQMPDFLYDPAFNKTLENMTTEELRGVHDAVKSIDTYSRRLHQQEVAGELMDFNDLIDNLTDRMKDAVGMLGVSIAEYTKGLPESALKRAAETYWASTVQLESIFNRFDRNNPYGIFNQAIVRKYVESQHQVNIQSKEFGRMIEKLSPIRSPNKVISQNLFIDPGTGEPIPMTRMKILAILQNMGNPGNFYGLLDGWRIPRERANDVMQLVRDNTFPEDWERARKLGRDIFGKAKDENDMMRRRLSGVAPDKIELWNVTGHNGKEYEGWYHPIIYDTDMFQKSKKLAAPDVLEYPYWAKSVLPSASFTKQRTGYIGYYSLDFDGVQNKLMDMVHDTAWRETLTDLQKIFQNQKFRSTLRASAPGGQAIVNLLDPFLKDLAGKSDMLDKNTSAGVKALQFIRQNLISHLVGFNPATLAKHTMTAAINSITEVGARDFARAFFTIVGQSPDATKNNWQFAMNKSGELPQRHRNMYENISSNFNRTYGHLANAGDMRDFLDNFKGRPFREGLKFAISEFKGNYMDLREAMHWVEAAPLAFFDLASAVPTWLAVYKREIRKGAADGDAVFIADRAVRRAHGSTAITSRAQIMRQSPLVQSFATFYGFFNHILMKQYEMSWAMRDLARGEGYYAQPPTVDRTNGNTMPPSLVRGSRERMREMEADYKKTNEYKEGAWMIPVLSGMLVSYVFAPALVDEFVSPEHKEKGFGPDKHESAIWYGTKTLAKGLSGSWWGARDVVHGLVDGGDVTSGVYGTGFRTGLAMVRNYKDMTSKTHPTLKDKERWIKNQNGLVNILTGIGLPNSVPRMGLFGADWYIGKEKPQTFREYWTGITQGTAHPSRRH